MFTELIVYDRHFAVTEEFGIDPNAAKVEEAEEKKDEESKDNKEIDIIIDMLRKK